MPFQSAGSISKPFAFAALTPEMIDRHMPWCRGALQTGPPQILKALQNLPMKKSPAAHLLPNERAIRAFKEILSNLDAGR